MQSGFLFFYPAGETRSMRKDPDAFVKDFDRETGNTLQKEAAYHSFT